MKYSLAYNGDLELIHKTEDLEDIEYYYGTVSKNPVGSGRPVYQMSFIGHDNIAQAIEVAHKYNKKFNVLMNAACLSNQEYTSEKRNEIWDFLKWLTQIGVDMVTIANPYIIDMCRSKYPELKISVSSFALVDSVESAKYYDRLGVSEITVCNGIERNYRLLEKMQKSVSCDLQIMVNQTCLYKCPLQQYHNCVISHKSQSTADNNEIDYCMLQCTLRKYKDTTQIIKSTWCRPEDIYIAESVGICRGKITDRNKSTEWLERAARAYCTRSCEGNLLEILNANQVVNKNSPNIISKNMDSGIHNFSLMKNLMGLDMSIDSKALDSLGEHFLNSNCSMKNCDECNYCAEMARKAVHSDPLNVKRIAVIEDYLKRDMMR